MSATYDKLLLPLNTETAARVFGVSPFNGTIGRAVRMIANTVRKYVCELKKRQLISTEKTTVTTGDGLKHNGSLLHITDLIQLALNLFCKQQLTQIDVAAERQRVATALTLRGNECDSV